MKDIKDANCIATSILEGQLKEDVDRAKRFYGIDTDKIYSHINDSYQDYLEQYSSEMFKLAVANIPGVDKIEDTSRFGATLDNLWAIKNSNIFLMNIDELNNIPMINDISLVDFDSISDCYITLYRYDKNNKLRYMNVYLDLLKDEESVNFGSHKNVMAYSIAYGLTTEHGIRYQFRIIKEAYPRLLVTKGMKSCKDCNHTNNMNYTFNNPINNSALPVLTCLSSEKHRESCNLFNEDINPQMAVSIIAYIADMYNNRYTLNRKNSRRIKDYNKAKIDIMAKDNEDNTIKVIPLLLYAKDGERYISHSEIHHSHHESPHEHIRREHTRKLKSGKVVKVKQCIVNKGKSKPIYKI